MPAIKAPTQPSPGPGGVHLHTPPGPYLARRLWVSRSRRPFVPTPLPLTVQHGASLDQQPAPEI